jgi:hypothetical protein
VARRNGDAWKNADWDVAAQKIFWSAVRRSSTSRYSVIANKAELLFETDDRDKKDAALSLLADHVNGYLDNNRGIRHTQADRERYKDDIISSCAAFLGELYERDNNPAEAEAAYRHCWRIYFDGNGRPRISTSHDSLHLLPKFLMKLGRCEEAFPFIEKFEKRVVEPDGTYGQLRDLCFLWAEYGEKTADYSRAVAAFTKYWGPALVPYEEFERQPVMYPDSGGQPYESPAAAAEAIVVDHHSANNVVFEKSRASLLALDAILGPNAPTREYRLVDYKLEFLREQLAPELGAYFGEVLCNQFNGKWTTREPLMRSRVKLKKREINPFEIGYQVAFFGRRLATEFDRLAKELKLRKDR